MNLNKLEVEREQALVDKADLFDFYHKNWLALFNYCKDLENKRQKNWWEFLDDEKGFFGGG